MYGFPRAVAAVVALLALSAPARAEPLDRELDGLGPGALSGRKCDGAARARICIPLS